MADRGTGGGHVRSGVWPPPQPGGTPVTQSLLPFARWGIGMARGCSRGYGGAEVTLPHPHEGAVASGVLHQGGILGREGQTGGCGCSRISKACNTPSEPGWYHTRTSAPHPSELWVCHVWATEPGTGAPGPHRGMGMDRVPRWRNLVGRQVLP